MRYGGFRRTDLKNGGIKMKKLICFLMAVLMSLSLIACGGGDDDEGGDDGQQIPGSSGLPGSGVELPDYPAEDWK